MAKKTLTLHLAKNDIVEFDDTLSEQARERLLRPTTRVVDDPNFAEGARLYVFVGDDSTPAWLRDLRNHFVIEGAIQTNSSAAVLIFRLNERLFASTFAHGWMYLNEDNFEGDFGLRVALNALDDSKLKRLERANLGDALKGISQSPFQRDFSSFGLDDALDLVRRISGRTKDESSADSLSGARSLKMSGEFSIADLPIMAAEAADFYGSTDYRDTTFRVVDFVTPVMDRRQIATLDDLAVESIKDRDGQFELGLPTRYDDDAVAYKFEGPRLTGRHPDLLLDDYTTALGNRLNAVTIETLRAHKIAAVYEDTARPDIKWSIRQSLVGSITHDEGRYAINEGEWYRVDDAFKQSVEENFQEVIRAWPAPPLPLRKILDLHGNGRFEREEDYNEAFADHFGYVLLDQKLIQIPGVDRSRFEACDVLDIQGKRFIHIKKSSRRSNILSHFFKQGSNSAQQFMRFPPAWDALRERILEISGDVSANLYDQALGNDDPWTIEFVIADSRRDDGSFNIPFFSKISLRDEITNLRAMQYDVALRFIALQ